VRVWMGPVHINNIRTKQKTTTPPNYDSVLVDVPLTCYSGNGRGLAQMSHKRSSRKDGTELQ